MAEVALIDVLITVFAVDSTVAREATVDALFVADSAASRLQCAISSFTVKQVHFLLLEARCLVLRAASLQLSHSYN